jgi:type III pantothenate kinase
VGQDTVSSIRAGIVYGTAGVCDGIIQRLMKKECKGFKVIATGGDVDLIQPYTAQQFTVEEFLICKGLALIYKSQLIYK